MLTNCKLNIKINHEAADNKAFCLKYWLFIMA